MQLNVDDLYSVAFDNDMECILNHDYTEYIEAGGRGSGKSSFFSIAIIILMLQHPEYNAVIVRKTGNTLRDSVYEQIKWACEQLGVSHLFAFTTSPLQIICRKTGQKISFRGSDDPLKIKSIKTSKGYTAITWFEELAEFTEHDLETIKLSTMRGGDKYYIFESYNPPSSARNWVNAYSRQNRKNRFFHLTDYRTTPVQWLGEAFIDEAEDMKANNPRAYENVFLGEPTGTGLNVFENIRLEKITDEQINSFDFTYQGIDWGYYPDPFIWVAFSYDREHKDLYVYDELKLYKHGNQQASDKLREYLSDKYYDEFLEDRIIADSAEPKSIADFRSYGWNCRASNKFPNSVAQGFKWLQSLHSIIIDPERCPECADEFSNFEHEIDKRTGEIIDGYPDGQPDHGMAAARYALEPIWQHRGE